MSGSRRFAQPVILALLFAVGALSVLGYSWLTRAQPQPSETRLAVATTAPMQSQQRIELRQPMPVEAPEPEYSTPQPDGDDVQQWIADAGGSDDDKRAEAIVALGMAPKEQALPALERALELADREGQQLALGALRTLAQSQGDADGRIRDIVEEVLSDGGDAGLTTGAQDTLEDIESDLNQQPQELSREPQDLNEEPQDLDQQPQELSQEAEELDAE